MTENISLQKSWSKLLPLVFVIWGVIGFGFGVNLILNGSNEKEQFHEINWDTREILNAAINNSLEDTSEIVSLIKEKQHLGFLPKGQDSLNKFKQIFLEKQQIALLKIRDKIAGLNNFDIQSLSSKYIRIDSLNLSHLKSMKGSELANFVQDVQVTLFDSTLVTKQIHTRISLRARAYSSDQFMLKYPNFGYWLLELLIQTVLYVLLIPFLLVRLFTNRSQEDKDRTLRICYASAVLLVCIGFYFMFLNAPKDEDNIVRNELFMRSLHTVFSIVNALGYIAATLCLTGMLLNFIAAKELRVNRNVGNVDSDSAAINADFKVNLTLAALILTFAVITTGQFYSALNSLSLVKAYNLSLGYDYFRIEVVYLYGILHTFLLLLFYIPVQMQLNATNNYLVSKVPDQNATNGQNDVVNTGKPFEPAGLARKFLDLLVVGSPLIAAFLKSILDLIFN